MAGLCISKETAAKMTATLEVLGELYPEMKDYPGALADLGVIAGVITSAERECIKLMCIKRMLVGKEIKLVSCGCCSNGCTCWNHRDVPNGRPERKCELHKDWTRDQFLGAWSAQYADFLAGEVGKGGRNEHAIR